MCIPISTHAQNSFFKKKVYLILHQPFFFFRLPFNAITTVIIKSNNKFLKEKSKSIRTRTRTNKKKAVYLYKV